MKKWIFIIALVFFAWVAVAFTAYYRHIIWDTPWPTFSKISNFEQCVARGFPIMESYPRKCRAGDNTFTEDIGNELEKTDLIKVSAPRPNQLVTSPLKVEGRARGSWYFEASFPVKLYDSNDNLLAEAPAQAQGDWMTTEFVPFRVELTFDPPTTKRGTLVLEKDNPSGLPENDDSLRVPVKFR